MPAPLSVQQTDFDLLMAAFFTVYNYVFICTPPGFLKQPVISPHEEAIQINVNAVNQLQKHGFFIWKIIYC